MVLSCHKLYFTVMCPFSLSGFIHFILFIAFIHKTYVDDVLLEFHVVNNLITFKKKNTT